MLHYLHDSVFQVLAIFGCTLVFYGLCSLFVRERLYLSEPIVACLIGILFGPMVAKSITPLTWFGADSLDRIVQELARCVIAIQVMAVGVSLPRGYVKQNWRGLAMFLGPIMIVMWVVSSCAVRLVLGLSWEHSFIIGACITPTDPVLASSVIKGKFANRYIPTHLRNLLSAESGANDGLGFPFLMLPIYLLKYNHNLNETMTHWFVTTWVYEILLSIVIGIIVGFSARVLLKKSEKHKLIDKESFLVFTIALAFMICGLTALVSSDDLLAVFIAGNAFTWFDDYFMEQTKDAHLQEVIDMLFNVTFFIFFGSIIPWQAYYELGYGKLFGLAGLVLLLRRLPIVVLLRPAPLRSGRETFFCGWFGPIGVGAIFFSCLTKAALHESLHNSHLDAVTRLRIEAVCDHTFTVVSFMVLSSIVVHGITVPITHFHLKTKAKRKLRKAETSQLQRLNNGRFFVIPPVERTQTVDMTQVSQTLPDELQVETPIVEGEHHDHDMYVTDEEHLHDDEHVDANNATDDDADVDSMRQAAAGSIRSKVTARVRRAFSVFSNSQKKSVLLDLEMGQLEAERRTSSAAAVSVIESHSSPPENDVLSQPMPENSLTSNKTWLQIVDQDTDVLATEQDSVQVQVLSHHDLYDRVRTTPPPQSNS